MNQHRFRLAFSLLELLLVVTIIGIVAAIVVPRVTTSTDKARETVRDSHVTQLNQAIERYYLDNEAWPTTFADIDENYLPDGVPNDPDGGSYSYNSTTMRAEYTP